MSEYLGVVTGRLGKMATCDSLSPACPEGVEIFDYEATYPIGSFVYLEKVGAVARIVTGETLPRPDLWERAVEAFRFRVPGNMGHALDAAVKHLATAREKSRRAVVDWVPPVYPTAAAVNDAFPGMPGQDGDAVARLCENASRHMRVVRLPGAEAVSGLGDVTFDLGKPVMMPADAEVRTYQLGPRDPDATCSCGATKAHEERVCGACFARVEPVAVVPEREDVHRARCPKCRSYYVGLVAEVTVRAEFQFATLGVTTHNVVHGQRKDQVGTPEKSAPRLVALTCRPCGHSWTPPEHLHHNWVKR